MKVTATKNWRKYRITDKDVNRIRKEGEQWDVTKARYNQLFKLNLVEEIKEKKAEEKKEEDK